MRVPEIARLFLREWNRVFKGNNMTTIIEPYLDKLTKSVYDQISAYLEEEEDKKLIDDHFSKRILNPKNKKQFANFQEYYFKTLITPADLSFEKLRQIYSLQGVDKESLKKLENNKEKIIKLIESGNLSDLYFNHFANVEIKRKNTSKEKNLGSFFTKIVHTFKPDDYTPLDIPLRKYFKLEGESYFVAFIVVSNAFARWASENENKERMANLRSLLIESIKDNLKELNSEPHITDMKIQNLIFWSVAQ